MYLYPYEQAMASLGHADRRTLPSARQRSWLHVRLFEIEASQMHPIVDDTAQRQASRIMTANRASLRHPKSIFVGRWRRESKKG